MISTSSQQDHKYLSLQFRCKGGSLPLKKRRFSMISDTDSSSHSQVSVPGVYSSSFSDEKLAALSLIASRASVARVGDIDEPLKEPTSTESSEEMNHDPEEKGASSASSQHDQSVPLDRPRVGGCHGRTSRNNSFCKRQPCYKGSRFCKLHYQQYVLSETSQKLQEDESPSSSKQPSCSPVPVAGEKKQGSFQDKRFSGSAGEVRCRATTTRGRECAYVAVCGGKYCNLHADYDNNPPPRRGGGGSSKKTSSTAMVEGGSSCDGKNVTDLRSSSSFSSESAGSLPIPTNKDSVPAKQKGSSERSKRRGSSAKIAKKHMDSPFPLLSMISTDQWANKRVKISVGPLSDRLGIVEKWSNGWVSVRVDGVGLHNRRSFELYLLQDNQDEPEETKPPSSANSSSDSTASVGSSRITPSPIATETPSTSKPIRNPMKSSFKVPVTPCATHSETERPITPSKSGGDVLYVPSITPNSPRRAMVGSADAKTVCDMNDGIFLSDCGEQPELALKLRVEALQQRLGGATAFSAHGASTAPETNTA